MFGDGHMIDESSYDMIDEMDVDVVDDIRDEKRRGGNHAGHLCDEGQSHESTDRHMSSAYNTTPRTSPSHQRPRQPAAKSTAPYPKPQMQQYTPQAAPHQERPMQTTIVNGRTYDRPAETPKISPAQQKATKWFTAFIIIGIVSSCLGSFLMLPVCIVLALMIMGSVKKCEGDDTAPVNRTAAAAICIAIFAFIAIIAGKTAFSMFSELLTETSDLGGY
jgi:hypothetical protein